MDSGIRRLCLPAYLPGQIRQACRAIACGNTRGGSAAMFSLPSACLRQADGRCEHTPRFRGSSRAGVGQSSRSKRNSQIRRRRFGECCNAALRACPPRNANIIESKSRNVKCLFLMSRYKQFAYQTKRASELKADRLAVGNALVTRNPGYSVSPPSSPSERSLPSSAADLADFSDPDFEALHFLRFFRNR